MPVAVRQTVANTSAGSASSIAVSITVLQYSCLHVLCACDDAGVFTTCGDGGPNIYTLQDQIDDAGNARVVAQFTTGHIAAGTYTVTANISAGSTNRSVAVREITGASGMVENGSLEQANPTTAVDATSSGPSGAIPPGSAMISGLCVRVAGSGAPAAGSRFTDDGSPWTNARLESVRSPSDGSGLAATFTAAADVSHISMIVAYPETVVLLGQSFF